MTRTKSTYLSLLAVLLSPFAANADLIALTSADFGSPDVTFSEVALLTPINGLTINGFTFSETIPDALVSNGGPGNTNSITQPSALSFGITTGQITTVSMPSLTSEFGFAFALLTSAILTDAVTLTLFNGAANLGSLIYGASPDPTFTGAFVGIGSTTPFDSVQIVFSSSAPAYDFDNISANAAVVPEPSTLALLSLGFLGLGLSRRKKV